MENNTVSLKISPEALTLNDIRRLKLKAEAEIIKALITFQDTTGLEITGITLESIQYQLTKHRVIAARIDVDL